MTPRVDYNDPETWASLYGGDGYVRANKDSILGHDHHRLHEVLGIEPGQSIILIGAGFGWVAEDWGAAGLGPIVAADSSTWIQTNKPLQATLPIYNENSSTGGSRSKILKALGQAKATWCISEDVMPALDDDEAVQLALRMRLMATNVTHWMSCGVRKHDDPNAWAGDPRLNWKTLEDWKELLTPDIVVARSEWGRRL
ncbi:MAG TPA: hypothetical protein VIZ32_22995 [Vicinamibacterales bacterium]